MPNLPVGNENQLLQIIAGAVQSGAGVTVTAAQISDASANGRSLITAADYAAMRTLLGAPTVAGLSANVTRTSNTVLSNTGLTALNVPITAGKMHLIEYSVFGLCGAGGGQVGLSFPTPDRMSGVYMLAETTVGTPSWAAANDWTTEVAASGDPIATPPPGDLFQYLFNISFFAAASGTMSLLFAQFVSNAAATTIYKSTQVRYTTFP